MIVKAPTTEKFGKCTRNSNTCISFYCICTLASFWREKS